jgi:hypothetical protein
MAVTGPGPQGRTSGSGWETGMAKKDSLLQAVKADFEAKRRQLGLAAMDFSLPDDTLVELRAELRRLQDEVRTLEKKSKKLFGIF